MSTRLRLDDTAWTPDGRPVWLEGRSDRSTLMRLEPSGSTTDLTPEVSVRAGVGYGGGDFTLSGADLFFVPRGGALARAREGRSTHPILPRFGAVASPAPSPDGAWVLYVHSLDEVDVLALAPTDGSRWPVDLVRGSDFYMQPTWHPDGRRIAWVEWDHPRMPWDGARLMVAELDLSLGRIVSRHQVAGGDDRPVLQPVWSPDGLHLAWVESDGDTYRLRVLSEGDREPCTLFVSDGLLPPAWVQGVRVLAWNGSRRLWALDSRQGIGRILDLGLDSPPREIDPGPYRSFSQIAGHPDGEQFLAIASASDLPERVVRWDGSWHEIALSFPSTGGHLPQSSPVSWLDDGQVVHGMLFTPRDLVRPPAGWPLLVNVHGGPTSARGASFSPDTCFFTDRGWAVLEVNYRGSTGYGERYRQALAGRWGELDTRDCSQGARAMIDQGVADPSRMAIKGGSSGGFTVLNVLAEHPGLFRAGISNYGVTDLVQLELTTHKFESRYLHSLVGPYPERTDLYHARSPVHRGAS
ncbi:MAG TPA: prolyl oligopeptidase family serine peptidase, partial [Fibrobacteria bacterium]|nr:prolyl oligopeptidase family serine peptidase [Fibrobacteria bacterium]